MRQWKRCREHVYACSCLLSNRRNFSPLCLCTAETSKTDNCTTNEVLGRAPWIHSRCIKWRHTPQNDGVKLHVSFSTPYTTYVVLEHLGDCSKCVVNYAVTLLISTLISAKYPHSAIAKRHTAQTNATAPHRKDALLHGPLYYQVSNGATRRLGQARIRLVSLQSVVHRASPSHQLGLVSSQQMVRHRSSFNAAGREEGAAGGQACGEAGGGTRGYERYFPFLGSRRRENIA